MKRETHLCQLSNLDVITFYYNMRKCKNTEKEGEIKEYRILDTSVNVQAIIFSLIKENRDVRFCDIFLYQSQVFIG